MKPFKLRIQCETIHVLPGDIGDDDALWDGREYKIIVSNKLRGDAIFDAIMHEVHHAIEDLLRIKIKDDDVQRFGTGSIQFLRDNPQFVKRLISKH